MNVHLVKALRNVVSLKYCFERLIPISALLADGCT